jgi:hypothetical protein
VRDVMESKAEEMRQVELMHRIKEEWKGRNA